MRRILIVGAACSALTLVPLVASANADAPQANAARAAQQGSPLRFAVIPELAARGPHGAPAEGPYDVEVTVEGLNSETHAAWSTKFKATSLGFVGTTLDPQRPGFRREPTLSVGHRTVADPTFITPIAAAITRVDTYARIKIEFRAYSGGSKVVLHALAINDRVTLASLRPVHAPSDDREELVFRFHHIVWTWLDENKQTKSDEWTMPHGRVGV
jgi:hypothetical protein